MMTSGHLERESLLALVERDPIEASTCPIALLFVPSVVLNLSLLDFLYFWEGVAATTKAKHDPHSLERAHLTMVGGSNQSAVEGSFKCTWVSKWWELYRGILLHLNLCCANSEKEKIWRKKRSRHFPARVSAILLPELWSPSRSPPGSSSPDNDDYVYWITMITYIG